jgi:hypothetical protein
MDPLCGSTGQWIHGTMVVMDPLCGSTEQWIYGSTGQWIHGTMDPTDDLSYLVVRGVMIYRKVIMDDRCWTPMRGISCIV